MKNIINNILMMIPPLLIGFTLGYNGIDYKSLSFWIILLSVFTYAIAFHKEVSK